ncbi:DUF1640 domain-containing protein [Paraherbaspirillum soli]|uniref:DUF1640 domain-containing protein n=1 Tax=Paraherbaspirillum soli TaxID=631222 RepID=A0ABW0M9F2_9BURK
MATVTFDTHKFVKTLEAAGLPEQQAEAISIAVRDSHESVDVATRRDVDDLRKDIDSKLEKMELRLTIKLGTIVMLALGAFTALSKWIA